ncbi:MAG: hypothetical protein AB7P23_09090 [Amphiplicatus sp.]
MGLADILNSSLWAQAAAIAAVVGGLFGLLKFIQSLTVPRSADYVAECIQNLRAVRSALNQRPQIIDPVSGNLRLRSPKSLKELADLYGALRGRHESNKAVYREIRHLLYPSQRGGLQSALNSSDKAVANVYKVISNLPDGGDDNAVKRAVGNAVRAILNASNKIVGFERRLLKAIDRSLELWAKRIG